MKIIKGLSLLVALSVAGIFAGCDSEATTPDDTASVDVEGMCVTWSSKSCAMLSGCCNGEANFDQFMCEIYLSGYCLDNLKLELAHSDQYIVDAAFAQECLTPINQCDPPEPTQAHPIACANMLTGYRPLGTGCFQTADCERPSNGRAYCYFGEYGDIGVCANIVESTNGKCGFSKETLVYSTCPENTYCNMSGVMMPPSEIPSDLAYEFEANCEAYRANGESCVDTEDYNFLPCQKDLYCNIDKANLAASKCLPIKKIGDPCLGESPDECGSAAYCDFETVKCVQDKPDEAPFCFAPPVCGDGECTTGEDYETCIQDCGICGDGYCSVDEEVYCYEDCGACGDGYCSVDEVGYCPVDCDICGDGLCTGDEPNTCPSDCNQMNCVSCSEYVFSQQMGPFCPGSESIILAFSQCMCAGPCGDVCNNSFCMGAEPSTECVQCAEDAMIGCGNEFNACASDF
jgi:hypothetical protein